MTKKINLTDYANRIIDNDLYAHELGACSRIIDLLGECGLTVLEADRVLDFCEQSIQCFPLSAVVESGIKDFPEPEVQNATVPEGRSIEADGVTYSLLKDENGQWKPAD